MRDDTTSPQCVLALQQQGTRSSIALDVGTKEDSGQLVLRLTTPVGGPTQRRGRAGSNTGIMLHVHFAWPSNQLQHTDSIVTKVPPLNVPHLPLLCRQRSLGAGDRVSEALMLLVVVPVGMPRGAGDRVPLAPVRALWRRRVPGAARQLRRRLLNHGRLVRLDRRRLPRTQPSDGQLWLPWMTGLGSRLSDSDIAEAATLGTSLSHGGGSLEQQNGRAAVLLKQRRAPAHLERLGVQLREPAEAIAG